MVRVLRWVFFVLVVRPVIMVILGLNVRHREKLPHQGPAVLTANHNSHLDALVLITLMPLRLLHRIRPVAAEDYFLSNKALAWFSTRIIGILPIPRRRTTGVDDPMTACGEALERGDILIFFPEGSRGEPEKMTEFRGGIGKLAGRNPEVPVTPIYLHGLGKALPKGEAMVVPFFLDVIVGEALRFDDGYEDFLGELRHRMEALAEEGDFVSWD
ncbi:lysophospholipid acyltransferase family protein [Halostreptopolyspora alba]|uniref:1-acyl-sn-glycerol-3-phosphate acyltransferase n=1 Tax=Halostreptopolyspora alba TaxID=2487137 RepID=A0A3N0EBU0_9ACTN|nr:1-acyl-sn-glycerol-3-phosphate acyltransferase [Nocardiopsaceae bacterium YIM 96095]